MTTPRIALEADEIEKGVDRSANDHFDRLLRLTSSVTLAPGPAAVKDLFDERRLELERDEVLGRTVKDGIEADEKALAGADPNEQRRIDAVRVLPEVVEVAVLFAAVLQLKAVLVARTIPGEPLVREIGVDDDPHPLASRGLKADAERSVSGIGAMNDSASGSGECFMNELKQRLAVSAADTIDAVRKRVINWSSHLVSVQLE
jgi:hypothetical protein